MKLVTILVVLLGLVVSCGENDKMKSEKDAGAIHQVIQDSTKIEGYQPEHPIRFPHAVHAEIDCKYCHYTGNESKTASIPSINVCMNCHRTRDAETVETIEELYRSYDSALLDNDELSKRKQIQWKKVEELPDSVFYNHESKYFSEYHERLLNYKSNGSSRQCSDCHY
ncbi:MAG: cytochrome c family protein [bacterium]|nr:cytochrome c family protein [bacterium]